MELLGAAALFMGIALVAAVPLVVLLNIGQRRTPTTSEQPLNAR